MKKSTILVEGKAEVTIGFDISDRSLQYCELNAVGEIVAEGQVKLTRDHVHRYLKSEAGTARIALETGGHAAWIREEIEGAGHEAIVANAREIRAVTGRSHRTDRHDARQLARLALYFQSITNLPSCWSRVRFPSPAPYFQQLTSSGIPGFRGLQQAAERRPVFLLEIADGVDAQAHSQPMPALVRRHLIIGVRLAG
jgi:Transposase